MSVVVQPGVNNYREVLVIDVFFVLFFYLLAFGFDCVVSRTVIPGLDSWLNDM